MNSILIKPLITEKSMAEAAIGRFTFVVNKFAEKSGIAVEIAKLYKVKPIKIQTSVVKGKKKRTGKKRLETKKSDWKKATVTLEKGQKIDLFDVTENQPVK